MSKSIFTPRSSTKKPFISPTRLGLAAALCLMPVSALANHTDAEIDISSTSPIFVSVSNLSGSTNVNERLLTMTTPATINVKGQAQCKNGSAVQSVQLHFGLDYIESGPNGHTLWGVWDSSSPQLFGPTNDTPFDITHDVNISPTWQLGTLVTIVPNAVKVVEDNLKAYVNNGGSALDFLRADAAFETTLTASATVACEKNGSVVFDTVSQTTTIHILYKGDPNLEVQTVGQNPNQVAPNQPALPEYAIYAPQLKGAIIVGHKAGGRGNAQPPGDDQDVRDPVTGDEISVAYAEFPRYNIADGYFERELWSGYVSYLADAVCSEPVMAVTGDGECVLLEDGCFPQEFDSCRTLDGCCDARSR
jgi:hypothetical protein